MAHLSQRRKKKEALQKEEQKNIYKKRDEYDNADRTNQNPVDQDKNILCFRCDSSRHLASKCQHKSRQHPHKTNTMTSIQSCLP